MNYILVKFQLEVKGIFSRIARYFQDAIMICEILKLFVIENKLLYIIKYNYCKLARCIIFTFTVSSVRLKDISSKTLTVITTLSIDAVVGTVSIIVKTLIHISTYWQKHVCVTTKRVNIHWNNVYIIVYTVITRKNGHIQLDLKASR